ncbi:hypothetical protein D3C80_1563200 [compost metagenome]
MLGVETASFARGQLDHFRSDDAQTGFLEAGQDFADHVLGDGVGLDDGEGTLQGHGKTPKARLVKPRSPWHGQELL